MKKKETKPQRLIHLIYGKKWDECIKAAELYPDQVELQDRMGDLPLHEACNSGAPFQVVQTLHRCYLTGIQKKGFCGRLPLHYASYNKPSLHVIKFLLRHYPDGASKFDDDGRLPLHLAVVRNAPKQAIQELISAYPKSLTVSNQFGNTPEMLARNDHVYELLIAEKNKPRKIDQHLDLEKKLMRDWFGGSKSPVQHAHGSKSPVSTSSTDDSTRQDSKESDDHASSTQRQKPIQQQQQQQGGSHTITIRQKSSPKKLYVSSPNARTTSMKYHQKNSQNSPPTAPYNPNRSNVYNTPRVSNKTHNSTKATRSAGKLLTTRRNGTNVAERGSSASTRSSSSGRSRSTIKGTHDDMNFMENSMRSNSYKMSTRTSPRSPKDVGNFPSQMRRPRSTIRKREVMSTNNRRKVLPSPTRVNMVVHPIWK